MKKSVRCGQKLLKNKRRLQTYTLAGLTFVCLSLISCLPVVTVRAETTTPQTQLSATVGYGGYYKRTDWVPVTLTIHHSGPAEAATLLVRVNQNLSTTAHAAGK